MKTIKQYVFNLLIAIDQAFNTLLGGDPDMTLSGRMGRAIAENRCLLCKGICWALHLIDSNHCQKANRREADEGANGVWK